MATAKKLDDITECTICTEVYTDPRVLPCGHTFCLNCLREWSKDKQPGDELACPLCRKEFTVPASGVGDLPKNYFVINFLQTKGLSGVETKVAGGPSCEACSDDKEAGKKVAMVYCVECQQKLCQTCESYHKKLKITASHQMIKLGEESNIDTLSEVMSFMNCDRHKGDQVRIYCLECKVAICTMCYIESHNSHAWLDVDAAVDDFRVQMTGDIDSIAAGAQRCRDMLQSLEKEKIELIGRVLEAEMKISKKADQLKQTIDVHKENLMTELSSMKQKRIKEIESLHQEIERQLLSMESYKKYVDEVRQKGTACDIARTASGLHDRAEELLKFDVIERTMAELGHADIMFAPSDFMVSDDVKKTLGQLKLGTTDATLTSSNVVTDDQNRTSGRLHLGDVKGGRPKLISTF